MQRDRTEGEREEGRRDLLGGREGERREERSYHTPASCWRLGEHRATHRACSPLLKASKELRFQGQSQCLWNPGPSTHGLNG